MTETKHQIRWYVWAGDEKIPHAATMRGTWGFDAACSCGWETRTGGALRGHIRDRVAEHKRDVIISAELGLEVDR